MKESKEEVHNAFIIDKDEIKNRMIQIEVSYLMVLIGMIGLISGYLLFFSINKDFVIYLSIPLLLFTAISLLGLLKIIRETRRFQREINNSEKVNKEVFI